MRRTQWKTMGAVLLTVALLGILMPGAGAQEDRAQGDGIPVSDEPDDHR